MAQPFEKLEIIIHSVADAIPSPLSSCKDDKLNQCQCFLDLQNSSTNYSLSPSIFIRLLFFA